jgi:hypothetical protein
MSEFDIRPQRGTQSALTSNELAKTTDQRFKDTRAGLIGKQRESMLASELHYLVSRL